MSALNQIKGTTCSSISCTVFHRHVSRKSFLPSISPPPSCPEANGKYVVKAKMRKERVVGLNLQRSA
ncbi:hypothetical protein P8452_51259 [Trifolium repens]|nr:hypothetical protein P8452_51259 [Trifolium repens]